MSAAESAMEQENYQRALANVDTALTQDSANVDAYMMKARILRQMADSTTPPDQYKELYARAREAEEKAIEFNPGKRSDVESQRELAYIQEYQKGANLFNQAQKSQDQDRFMQAAASFGAAAAMRPDSTGPILNEAFARLQAAQFAEGEESVNQMKDVIPILEQYIEKAEEPSKNAYTILSQLYLQNEQPGKTIEVTEQAIDDLSSRPTHFQLSGTQDVKYAGTVEAGGSPRNVEGTVPGRVNISADDGTVSGSFYKKQGGKRQTKGQVQIGLYMQGTEVASGRLISPSDTASISEDLSGVTPLAELRNARLNALNRTGDTTRAMQAYREQIEQNPENATYRYNYGSLLLDTNRYDEAVEQLAKAVEHDPNDPKKQYNLGAAYLNQGVALQDSLVSLRDSVMEKDRNPTKEERNRITELDEQRLELFEKAIPPLERARQLSGSDGQYRQSACSALLQAYVQTEQTEKAQEVEECAGQNLNTGGEGGGN
jgi:tetratricopeptide (TPR) repeat protein